MALIGVRISDNDYKYAQQFAKFKGVKLATYLRNLLEEKIEEFEDERIVEKLEKDMEEHPEDYETTYTLEEVAKELKF